MSEVESTKSIPSQNNINLKDCNQSISIVPNQQSIKMEVLQFKDEVLKELKLLKKSMTEKFESNTSLISEKFDIILRLTNFLRTVILAFLNCLPII